VELAGVENTKRQDVAVYDLKLSNGALVGFQWAFNKLAGTPTSKSDLPWMDPDSRRTSIDCKLAQRRADAGDRLHRPVGPSSCAE
jgi:hypothetical protein